MRAYTLALLSKLTADGKTMADKDIVDWVNNKVCFVFWLIPGKQMKLEGFYVIGKKSCHH